MSYYYTKQGYALLAVETRSSHQFGGEPYHEGAKFPVCKTSPLLLADLDCAAIRKKESAKLFRELDRLPLYCCWTCCAEKLFNRVINESTIRVLISGGEPQGDDFPYTGFPMKFEQRPVELVPIP